VVEESERERERETEREREREREREGKRGTVRARSCQKEYGRRPGVDTGTTWKAHRET